MKYIKIKILSFFLVVMCAIMTYTIPVSAAMKETTRTGAGINSTGVTATMTYNVAVSSGIVSNGKVTKVVKAPGFIYSVYINGSKSASRASDMFSYTAVTSGMWTHPGDYPFLLNINVKGFK